MITLEQATQLKPGDVIYHISEKNADRTAVRARVNGKIKLWKREPGKFRLPMKYGFKTCFYLTRLNAQDWTI